MEEGSVKRKRHVDKDLLEEIRLRRCCVCNNKGYSDPSHIISRGAGGPDARWNVVPMCRLHHSIWHKLGVSYFLGRYPEFELTLRGLRWEIEKLEGGTIQIRHPEDRGR